MYGDSISYLVVFVDVLVIGCPFAPDALHLVPTPLAQKVPPDVALVQRMLMMILLMSENDVIHPSQTAV